MNGWGEGTVLLDIDEDGHEDQPRYCVRGNIRVR